MRRNDESLFEVESKDNANRLKLTVWTFTSDKMNIEINLIRALLKCPSKCSFKTENKYVSSDWTLEVGLFGMPDNILKDTDFQGFKQ